MKKFCGIILGSISCLIAGGWLVILLLHWSVLYIGEQFDVDTALLEKLALVVVTTTIVGIGGIVYGEEADRKLQTDLQREKTRAQNEIDNLNKYIGRLQREKESINTELEKAKNMYLEFLRDTEQSSPWLAAKVADVAALVDGEMVSYLRRKRNPALKAAEQVKEISREKRELLRRNKEMEYQLQFYEEMFPWLEEFKTLPVEEAAEYVYNADADYDSVRYWLSPEEYSNLSEVQKNQLALDRYMKRKKTDWDVGIEYERYIGYICESDGGKAHYIGAQYGIKDMGRDLILETSGGTFVVQCKRWAKEKVIHEKHIFQLFGTTTLLKIKNPSVNYVGLFVTTATLSDLAKECAERLQIRVVENYSMQPYPVIKCNISANGEKIYHLPMDQQYDRVQIAGKEGAMFAWTVKEAEDHGFRRAHRWIPN